MSGDFPCCESGECRRGCPDNAEVAAESTTARRLVPGMFVVNLGMVTTVAPSSVADGWLRLTIANGSRILNSASVGVDVSPETRVYVLADVRPAAAAPDPRTITPADDMRALVSVILTAESFEDLKRRVRMYRSATYGRRP